MSLLKELYLKVHPQKPIVESTVKKVLENNTHPLKVVHKKKPKKKVAESKKLNKTLMYNMLESTWLDDQTGMKHLKHKVDMNSQSAEAQAAHRHYMHLQAADRLTPEERDELAAMAHSKTKAAPNPVKKLEWDLHQAESQLEHHQAHLNRANAKLQDPTTSDYIKQMIQHITIPEQKKSIDKWSKKVDQYHSELSSYKI